MTIHQRDPASGFADAFHANYADVLGYVTRRIGETRAEDVTAEVFTRAWQSWTKAPADKRPWLFGIARHIIVDNYRAQQRESKLFTAMHDVAAPPTYQMDPAANLDLQAAWAKLPTADKEALTLVAWEGLTGTQAALVLGCTRAAFSVRLSRARRRLKALLVVQPAITPTITSVSPPAAAQSSVANREATTSEIPYQQSSDSRINPLFLIPIGESHAA